MPLGVRNALRNPVVFTKKDLSLAWAPAGDMAGNDFQWCPDSIVDDHDFLDTVARGTLVIEEAEDDVRAKIVRFTSRRPGVKRLAEQEPSINAVIDRQQDKDITTGQCLECGASILTTVKQNEDKPPLCNQHAHLAPQYSLTESGTKGTDPRENGRGERGSLTKTWTKAIIVR